MPRIHIVLVPGFGGFDALGQLEYYAAVTPLFDTWRNAPATSADDVEPARRREMALHYFDNLPTASVATRAKRLERYLLKRIFRGVFGDGDHLVLVGHSTGGLDIRKMLFDIAESAAREVPLDGSPTPAEGVSRRAILERVRAVVFLSVPQWGTNIANWVDDHRSLRLLIVNELRILFAAARSRGLPRLFAELLAAGSYATATLIGADFPYALGDAIRETRVRCGDVPSDRVKAREAAADLMVWLQHIGDDFGAIHDLRAFGTTSDNGQSPAHFDTAKRAIELGHWAERGIVSLSFVTLGRRVLELPEDESAAGAFALSCPCDVRLKPDAVSKTDLPYRLCYRACAGGPLGYPPGVRGTVLTLDDEQVRVQLWDNDGIVNTASQLWPDPSAVEPVSCDHMDIVGHYWRVDAPRGSGYPEARKFQTYDLLGSDPPPPGNQEPFAAVFEQVWRQIFRFAASRA